MGETVLVQWTVWVAYSDDATGARRVVEVEDAETRRPFKRRKLVVELPPDLHMPESEARRQAEAYLANIRQGIRPEDV